MSALEQKICDLIIASGEKELTIIYNSAYETSRSRMVYVSVDSNTKEDSSLQFYTKFTSKGDNTVTVEGEPLAVGITQKSLIPDYMKNLEANIFGNSLFGNVYDFKASDSSYPAEFTVADANIFVNEDLKILIIESVLYSIGKMTAMNNVMQKSVTVSNVELNAIDVSRLKSSFIYNSYILYRSLLNHKISSKIVNRLLTASKFYRIQKAFVPVFIQIKGIYNPLLDNPDNKAIISSDFYKIAVEEKKRFLDLQGQLSAYMLTHREISKAFHLDNLIRFSPLAAYDLFVGLILTDCSVFPNLSTSSYIAPKSVILPTSFKRYYNDTSFQSKASALLSALDLAKSDNDQEKIKELSEDILVINQYQKGTSLQAYCYREYSNFINFASLTLDTKVTEEDLYSYLSKIRL